MDLSDISRERTLVDLAVARARILALTFEIDSAAAELASLRADLPESRAELSEAEESVQGFSSSAKSSRTPFKLPLINFWRRPNGRGAARWHVDEICGELPSRSKMAIEHRVDRSDSWMMSISGWMVPAEQSSAYQSVRLLMAGPTSVVSKQASIHLRDDVAAHLGNAAFAMSGFRFEVPMSELESGVYTLDLVPFSEGSGESRVRLGRVEVA